MRSPPLSNKLTLPSTDNANDDNSLFNTVNESTAAGFFSILDVDLMNTPEIDGVPVSYS